MSSTTDHTRDRHRRQHSRDGQGESADLDTGRSVPDPVEGTRPDAVQAAKTTNRGRADQLRGADRVGRARGVEWVRPTDLLARQSAAVAGRGIDFEVELARRTRRLSGHLTRAGGHGVDRVGKAISERARRLPDVSELGRGSQRPSWVSRSGIGLG